jgi:hypothetical protein
MLEFKILKMEQWMAVDAHNGGVEALNGALQAGSVYQWSQIRITLMRSRIRIRISIKGKSRIPISIQVKN